MKKVIFLIVVFVGIAQLWAGVQKYNQFDEAPVKAIHPKGHLEKFLRAQVNGLTGHPEKLGYPFNTTMWEGPLDRIVFTEGLYHGRDEVKTGDNCKDFWNTGMWWPYEQTAYLLDGMARVSAFVDAPELDARVQRNLNWVFAHANPTNGNLFTSLSASESQWPMVVFFRAAWAEAEKTGDWSQLVKAFAAHYDGLKTERKRWVLGSRDGLNIEGMLKVMEFTGDKSLLDDAKIIYAQSQESQRFGVKRHIVEHGVTLSEALKIPVILYIYTGETAYLAKAKKALENIYAMNEQADGLYSANEFTSGRDPRQGHETCITADMIWTLGYFLVAAGDIEAADYMERIAYNALPGSCTKDFCRHQYVSAVNQLALTPFSNNSHFNFAEATWRQYRPSHFPQCCTGNINRAMPSFVRRMWLLEKCTSRPVAMLYGPSEFSGEKDGVEYTILEETEYPFGESDSITFKLVSKMPMNLEILCRIPSWVDRPDAGKLVPLKLCTDSPTTLKLPTRFTLESDRHWHWVRRGPLTYSFAPPATISEESPGDPFSSLRIEAKEGSWNFAIDPKEVGEALQGARSIQSVLIPVHRIREWQTLEDGRFTPDPPIVVHPTGERCDIRLVPYASTLQRITCFPDITPRKLLPIVSVYMSGELYPYVDSKPLASQIFAPETWPIENFLKYELEVPRRGDLFADLAYRFLGKVPNGKLAYMVFRVWSDEDCPRATWCLSAGYEVQAFLNGREVYRTEGMTDPSLMAPVWIEAPVKKGYNYMMVKLAYPSWLVAQYMPFWGAKLQVFVEE